MRTHNGIERIDHPVIAVTDLDEARDIYERLGFTVPPRGSHVQWGTGNLCIMFPDDYLEMRGIIDASRFTMHLDSHLEKYGEGLMGVAFGTADVRTSYSDAKANGINCGQLRQLTRNFEHPEGWTQPSFELFAPDAGDIEGLMHVVVIQHLTPELIRRPEFLVHANGCIGVNCLGGTIADVDRCADRMRRLLGEAAAVVTESGVHLRLPSGQHIDLLLADAKPRLNEMTLQVRDIEDTREYFRRAGVDFSQADDDEIELAPADTCGVTLRFTEKGPNGNSVRRRSANATA